MHIAPETKQNLGAAHTVSFVQAHASAGSTLLDAGCGNGVLARQLIDVGFRVTAIDSHAAAVEEANKIGIAAKQASFLEYESDQTFDLVLLSRSFHHMQPLATAVKQARALLKPDGLLLLEEFAAELMDKETAVWFYGLKTVLKAAGICLHGHGPKIDDNGGIPKDPLESWGNHHFGKHGVATSTEILAALQTGFQIIEQKQLAYLYRYFVADVSEQQAEAIFQWESLLCELGTIKSIGLRIVARSNKTR